MFKFFDQAYNDIIIKILSYLDPEDLKSIQQVSKKLKRLSLNNLIWQRLFKEHFGFLIKLNDNCREKFIIQYLFEKGDCYSKKSGCHTKEIQYFKLVYEKIVKLDLTDNDDQDKFWKSYILGYLCILGYLSANSYDKSIIIELGIKYLEEAADLDNIKAMHLLTVIFLPDLETCHYNDIGLDIDDKLDANELLVNQSMPLYHLPDIIKGVKRLNQMYEKGDYETACLFAKFHMREDGYEELNIKYDKVKAISILEKSAKNGNIKAIYYLKEIYLKEAKEIYEQSPLTHSFYLQEHTNEKDREYDSKSKELIESFTSETIDIAKFMSLSDDFAHQGSKVAASFLSRSYRYGSVKFQIEPNPIGANYYNNVLTEIIYQDEEDEIIEMMQKIDDFARQGSEETASFLSRSYRYGSDKFEIEPNPTNANYYNNVLTEIIYQEEDELFEMTQKIINCLEMAGNLGEPEAFLDLGKSYLKGHLANDDSIITTIDIQKGLEYMKKAFLLGSSEAAYLLGCIYSKDNPDIFHNAKDSALGVDINIEEGIKWFERGSKVNNDKDAQHCALNLAAIYSDDDECNVTPNFEKTLYWYNKAIELGSKDAILLLARLYLKGDSKLGLSSNISEAAKLYEKAFYCEGNADGKLAITIAQDYKDANDLAQYIKWNIRGIALGEKSCASNLRGFFNPLYKPFIEPSIKSKYVILFKEFESIYKNVFITERINLEKLSLLAKDCYEVLDLPVIEDEFILRNDQNKNFRMG